MKKQPEQTEQTRKNLMEAFWRIYESEGYSACSVRRVTELAGYCRSTFYEYFRDVPDLLEQLENVVVARSAADVEALFTNMSMDQFRRSVEGIHTDHGREFNTFLVKNQNMGFYVKMKDAVCDTVLRNMQTEQGERFAPYVVEFAAAGYINAFIRWYRNGQDIPLEEIGTFIFELLRHGVLPAAKRTVKSAPVERLIFTRE